MKAIRVGVSVTVGLMAAAMLLWVGCEESTTDISITVSPASADLTNGEVITFTASLPTTNSTRQIYYPLEWQMSNTGLGVFTATTGDTAIYVAAAVAGVNTITVRDQAGSEGAASVVQTGQ